MHDLVSFVPKVLLLVKLQAAAIHCTVINTPQWVYFTFYKLYKWYQSSHFGLTKSFQDKNFMGKFQLILQIWNPSVKGALHPLPLYHRRFKKLFLLIEFFLQKAQCFVRRCFFSVITRKSKCKVLWDKKKRFQIFFW